MKVIKIMMGVCFGFLVNIAYAGVPLAPTVVTATPNDGSVTISWNNGDGAHGYNLYWGTNPEINIKNNFDMKVPGITASPFTQTTLTNGVTYYFIIQSVNNKGSSYGSSVIAMKPEKACKGAVELQAEIDELFVKYGKLTGNKQKAERLAIKGQIIYLTSVMKAEKEKCDGPKKQYKDIDAGFIGNNAEAQNICPNVCESASGTWSGQWTNIITPSVCGCWVTNK